MSAQRASRLAVGLFALGLATLTRAELRVVGSDLLGPEFQHAVAVFSRENDTPVALKLRGTRPGLEALRAGRADVGLFMFPAGESPPDNPFHHRPLGYQTVMVLVPLALPVTQITVDQLRGIFGAAATIPLDRWGALGLTGDARLRAIAPHVLAPGRGLTLPLFRRVVLQDGEIKGTIGLEESMDLLFARVRGADNTIGLSPALPSAPAGLRVLTVAASASEPAYAPTSETLHDGTYPLRLPLFLVFPQARAPQFLQFLKFLVSDECAQALTAANFVPVPKSARNQASLEFEVLH